MKNEALVHRVIVLCCMLASKNGGGGKMNKKCQQKNHVNTSNIFTTFSPSPIDAKKKTQQTRQGVSCSHWNLKKGKLEREGGED